MDKENVSELKEKIKDKKDNAKKRVHEKVSKIKHKEQSNGLEAHKKLKTLITIIPREKASFYTTILEGYHVNLQDVIYGTGTAPDSAKLHLDVKKAVIISVVSEDKIKDIMTDFEDNYFKQKNCAGIAFTIPLTSIIGVKAYEFLSYEKED